MSEMYRTTIHGQVLESWNLKELLSQAVSVKREMDRRVKIVSALTSPMISSGERGASVGPAIRNLGQAG